MKLTSLFPLLLALLVTPTIVRATSVSYAAEQRMHNRAMLLKHYHQVQSAKMVIIRGNQQDRRAVRAHNRQLIKQHPEWFPGPWKAGDDHWHHQLAENKHFLSSNHLHNITEVVVHRLTQQLGKPYQWGGTSPQEGFDCSGLVFFAYNKLLASKLPRTANEMYHSPRALTVASRDLRRGDLLFFHIHTREKADHMGVYLGKGKFIQAPRTGEKIQISDLDDVFWQAHFLGARRILTENTIL